MMAGQGLVESTRHRARAYMHLYELSKAMGEQMVLLITTFLKGLDK
jgi:hypothetical protein